MFPNRSMQEINDSELWEEMQKGDRMSFSLLYDRHVDFLHNYSKQYKLPDAHIQDCIQELFIDVWNKRKGLAKVQIPKIYLLTSLKRRLLKQKKKNEKSESIEDKEIFEIELSHESKLIFAETNESQIAQLNKAIESLSPREREALFLVYFENLPYEQAAIVMDVKVKTMYNFVHMAVNNLRKKLKGNDALLFFVSIAFSSIKQ